jgi:hypothetical protein
MSIEKDWDAIRADHHYRAAEAGMGVLRITLLFGSAAVALALIVTPFLASQTRQQFARDQFGVDAMTTGSINRQNIYTLRRSVLQSSPDSICIIHANGARNGDC